MCYLTFILNYTMVQNFGDDSKSLIRLIYLIKNSKITVNTIKHNVRDYYTI